MNGATMRVSEGGLAPAATARLTRQGMAPMCSEHWFTASVSNGGRGDNGETCPFMIQKWGEMHGICR